MTTSYAGGCLCGAIRYTLDGPIPELRACHCTHCQKSSGTAASINAVMPAANLVFTQGTPKRYVDTAQSGNKLYRHFCVDCGSPIYSQRATAPGIVVVRAGTFDQEPAGLKITKHIWTASARPWMHIGADTEQHPASMPL